MRTTGHGSIAAYPCHECRNPRGPTFYSHFKEYIVIASARGHVSRTTFSAAAVAAATVVACPCTPPAKTGPPLNERCPFSRRFCLSDPRCPRKGIFTRNLHSLSRRFLSRGLYLHITIVHAFFFSRIFRTRALSSNNYTFFSIFIPSICIDPSSLSFATLKNTSTIRPSRKVEITLPLDFIPLEMNKILFDRL